MKFVVKNSAPLLQVLCSEGGYATSTKAREVIKNGAVWVNNVVQKVASTPVESGANIEVNPKRSKQEADHAKYAFSVLFEDDFLIAVAKPPRVKVTKNKEGKPGFIDVVLHSMQEEKNRISELEPLTSIDTNGSGVLLLAKNRRTALALQAKKSITKTWIALVEGKVTQEEGVLSYPMLKLKTGKWVASEKAVKGSVEASTHFKLKKNVGSFSMLKLQSEDPKPKQFQAQLQVFGYPVAGEKKYGASINFSSRSGLHLEKIEFLHPLTKKSVTIIAPLPQSFTRAARYY